MPNFCLAAPSVPASLISAAGDGSLHLWKIGDLLEKWARPSESAAPDHDGDARPNRPEQGYLDGASSSTPPLVDLRPTRHRGEAVLDMHVQERSDGSRGISVCSDRLDSMHLCVIPILVDMILDFTFMQSCRDFDSDVDLALSFLIRSLDRHLSKALSKVFLLPCCLMMCDHVF
jgi:hypothetical protein